MGLVPEIQRTSVQHLRKRRICIPVFQNNLPPLCGILEPRRGEVIRKNGFPKGVDRATGCTALLQPSGVHRDIKRAGFSSKIFCLRLYLVHAWCQRRCPMPGESYVMSNLISNRPRYPPALGVMGFNKHTSILSNTLLSNLPTITGVSVVGRSSVGATCTTVAALCRNGISCSFST